MLGRSFSSLTNLFRTESILKLKLMRKSCSKTFHDEVMSNKKKSHNDYNLFLKEKAIAKEIN